MIRYGPLSTCPPSQSSEPNCPDWLKKWECSLLRAPVHGWALVGVGLPVAKLVRPVDDVCPSQTYGASGARPALSSSLTRRWHVITRSHRPMRPVAAVGVGVVTGLGDVPDGRRVELFEAHPAVAAAAASRVRAVLVTNPRVCLSLKPRRSCGCHRST